MKCFGISSCTAVSSFHSSGARRGGQGEPANPEAMTLPVEMDPDTVQRKEAWEILGKIFLELERVSDAGSLPENLEAAVADQSNFLAIALERQIPTNFL